MVFKPSAEQEALCDSISGFLSENFPAERLVRLASGSEVLDASSLNAKFRVLGLGEYFASPDSHRGAVRALSLLAAQAGRHLCPYPLYQGALASFLSGREDAAQMAVTREGAGDTIEGLDTVAAVVVIGIRGEARLRRIKKAAPFRGLDLVVPHLKVEYEDDHSQLSVSSLNCLQLWGLLRAAEISGLVENCIELTVEHAKQRIQFGAPIGTFQAIQHALAEVHVESQALSALVKFSAWAAESSPGQFPLATVSALRHACEKAPKIVETAIQLHGGIGFTWESVLHLYLRRVHTVVAEARGLAHAEAVLSHYVGDRNRVSKLADGEA